MTNRSAVERARSMIVAILQSPVPGLAERNKTVADGYIISLLDCGLIERNQYEELRIQAELALSRWRARPNFEKHL